MENIQDKPITAVFGDKEIEKRSLAVVVKGKVSRLCRPSDSTFVPAREHEYTYLGSSKTRKEKLPDLVIVASHSFRVPKSGKLDTNFRKYGSKTSPYRLVVIPDDYVTLIEAKEQAIATMRKQLGELYDEAARHGRDAVIGDLKPKTRNIT